MKILFTIGGFPIHLFGLTIALGIMAGYYVMLREVKRKGLDADKTSSLALYVVVAAIVNTAPKMGPTQLDQPMAKVRPNK